MAEQKDPDDGGKKLDVIVESESDHNVLISHNWRIYIDDSGAPTKCERVTGIEEIWDIHMDDTSKHVYYFNADTGTAQWDPPHEDLIDALRDVTAFFMQKQNGSKTENEAARSIQAIFRGFKSRHSSAVSPESEGKIAHDLETVHTNELDFVPKPEPNGKLPPLSQEPFDAAFVSSNLTDDHPGENSSEFLPTKEKRLLVQKDSMLQENQQEKFLAEPVDILSEPTDVLIAEENDNVLAIHSVLSANEQSIPETKQADKPVQIITKRPKSTPITTPITMAKKTKNTPLPSPKSTSTLPKMTVPGVASLKARREETLTQHTSRVCYEANQMTAKFLERPQTASGYWNRQGSGMLKRLVRPRRNFSPDQLRLEHHMRISTSTGQWSKRNLRAAKFLLKFQLANQELMQRPRRKLHATCSAGAALVACQVVGTSTERCTECQSLITDTYFKCTCAFHKKRLLCGPCTGKKQSKPRKQQRNMMDRLMNETKKREEYPPHYDLSKTQTRSELKRNNIKIKKKPTCAAGKILRRQKSDGELYCSICSKELPNSYYNCDCEKHKDRFVCGSCIVPRVRQEQKEQRARMNVLIRKRAWRLDAQAKEEKAVEDRRRRKKQAKCCSGKPILKRQVEPFSKIKCYLCNDFDTAADDEEDGGYAGHRVEIAMQEGETYFACDCEKHRNRTVCAVHRKARIRQEAKEQRDTMSRISRPMGSGDYLLRARLNQR